MRVSSFVFTLLTLAALALWAPQAGATARYFRDIVARSPNGNYEVQAKSPDNEKGGWGRFQSHFVYKCLDKKAGKLLWTRKQDKEASPVAVLVSDDGWTVIRTGWDELIAVNSSGAEKCRIKLLSDALTEYENKQYVHQTTAGPMWAKYSLWYFLSVGDQRLFVIRPWWGRRVVVDIEKGKLTAENETIAAAIADYERTYVLNELTHGIETRNMWESENGDRSSIPIDAAYLAGALKLREAIPLLQKLQDSTYCGSSTSGGLSALGGFHNEVDPHSYETLQMRQLSQLSLRRLGETPTPFAANRFEVRQAAWNGFHAYVPKLLSVPRQENSDKVHAGMKAEQVLDLLDGPDFVGYDTWEYDMDGTAPFTLIIKWDARKTIGVERKTPPLWKDGFARDERL